MGERKDQNGRRVGSVGGNGQEPRGGVSVTYAAPVGAKPPQTTTKSKERETIKKRKQ